MGVGGVHQPAHLAGEVRHGASFGDGVIGQGAHAPAGQGFAGQEDVAGASAAVLIVLASWTPGLWRQRLPQIGQRSGPAVG